MQAARLPTAFITSASASSEVVPVMINIALIKLTKAALCRAVGPPDGLNLVALEHPRQAVAVLGHHARQRNGEVVAQSKLGQVPGVEGSVFSRARVSLSPRWRRRKRSWSLFLAILCPTACSDSQWPASQGAENRSAERCSRSCLQRSGAWPQSRASNLGCRSAAWCSAYRHLE